MPESEYTLKLKIEKKKCPSRIEDAQFHLNEGRVDGAHIQNRSAVFYISLWYEAKAIYLKKETSINKPNATKP